MSVEDEYKVELQQEDQDKGNDLVSLHCEAHLALAILHTGELCFFPALLAILQRREKVIAELAHNIVLISGPEHKNYAYDTDTDGVDHVRREVKHSLLYAILVDHEQEGHAAEYLNRNLQWIEHVDAHEKTDDMEASDDVGACFYRDAAAALFNH